MFTLHFFIDTFQSTKRQVFNQIVKDPELQKVAANYLDAQTTFAKMLVDNTITVASHSLEKMNECCFGKSKEKSTTPNKKVD